MRKSVVFLSGFYVIRQKKVATLCLEWGSPGRSSKDSKTRLCVCVCLEGGILKSRPSYLAPLNLVHLAFRSWKETRLSCRGSRRLCGPSTALALVSEPAWGLGPRAQPGLQPALRAFPCLQAMWRMRNITERLWRPWGIVTCPRTATSCPRAS